MQCVLVMLAPSDHISLSFQPLLTGPLAGGSALAPLINGRVLPSVVSDGTEPKLVSYLSQTRVLSVACGKNHMLAITDNGVCCRGRREKE